jgi:hypothetical protein
MDKAQLRPEITWFLYGGACYCLLEMLTGSWMIWAYVCSSEPRLIPPWHTS